MIQFSPESHTFVGSVGSLPIADQDLVSFRLALLLEGECELGPQAAAEKFGICRTRYFQLRQQFQTHGAAGLMPQKPGPKSASRRTDEVVRQVIRHRFLDPQAGATVITQKLVQTGVSISCRTVERIIQDYGLQKKTLPATSTAAVADRDPTDHDTGSDRTL
jgi:hypothetical protein